MNRDEMTFSPQEYTLADQASRDARAEFISKTYFHLFGAIVAFIGIEAALLASPFPGIFFEWLSVSPYMWLVVLGLFMGVSYVANSWAMSSTSVGMQYAGLGLYIVAMAVLSVPLLAYAAAVDASIIPTAGVVTLVTFGALTAVVFVTRMDFSFLRPFLTVAIIAAMGLIVCSIIFGFNLGILFTVVMIVVFCGYILYDTSNVLHHYHIGQHVAAALALFSSVILLFWYVVRLFLATRE